MNNQIKISGGNGDVRFDGNIAIKTLRNTSKASNISRFLQEVRVAKELANDDSLNIAKVIDVYENTEKPQESTITMKKYDGTIEDLLQITQGNLYVTLNLILPIIETLNSLANRKVPLYHRDIKPDNILYEKNNDEYHLVLADFGICYLADDTKRLTQQEISIGPRFFIAPEYEIGRVENITSSGDIFSLGKVIWWLLWGEKGQYMPSNFWYVKEYNLVEKYKKPEMLFANYIIASCLKIEPDQRISYEDLIKRIKSFISEPKLKEDVKNQIEVQMLLEKRKNELLEIRQMNRNIVNIFSKYLIDVLNEEVKRYEKFEVIQRIYEEYSKKSKDGISYTTKNVDDNSSHYLYSLSYDNIYCSINYNPAKGSEKYANITFNYIILSSGDSNEIKVFYSDKEELECIYKNKTELFDKTAIYNFIKEMIDSIIESYK
ncbi:protein kinase [Phocaeicola vulgatus]|uniref:protein kinase domain-containing protein n=1 Tax=Phocaeicola vulgatus TaxID=821 RepID=UPI001C38BAE0|nr:protein kinase [Phocaeicola vulgatus]MBV4207907.1 protein kinase [Phocaeicola vulgatus]MBV4212243.1 protein kinase [Phocaeicola vulgatus]MCB6672209.1 protein kinase [Phocaeicola vulgatus]MCB6756071.1 protein kinase [Phocaeicola vulgatus]MCB6765910.1 protein kinase [Phocaeicola vulgatus]